VPVTISSDDIELKNIPNIIKQSIDEYNNSIGINSDKKSIE